MHCFEEIVLELNIYHPKRSFEPLCGKIGHFMP